MVHAVLTISFLMAYVNILSATQIDASNGYYFTFIGLFYDTVVVSTE